MMKLYRAFFKAEQGTSLIEFAFVFPVMLLLVFGSVEAAKYITVNQRVEKSGFVLTDITTQFQQQSDVTPKPGELTEDELRTKVFPQMAAVMGSVADPTKQTVIFTSLRMEGGVKKIKWQAVGGGTLTTGVSSIVNGRSPSAIDASVKDTVASLPADVEASINMKENEDIIVGEFFFRYTPVLLDVLTRTQERDPMAFYIQPTTLVKRVYLSPRNDVGQLVCLPPDFVYPECTLVMNSGGGSGGSCTPTSRCVGGDTVTTDCDGIEINRAVCNCASGSASCVGTDYVERDCHGNVTNITPLDIAHGCYVPPCTGSDFDSCSGTTGIYKNSCGAVTRTVPNDPSCISCSGSSFDSCSGTTGIYKDSCGAVTGTVPNDPSCVSCSGSNFDSCSGTTGIYKDSCGAVTGAVPNDPSCVSCSGSNFDSCSGTTGIYKDSCGAVVGSVANDPSCVVCSGSNFDSCSGTTGIYKDSCGNVTGTVANDPSCVSSCGGSYLDDAEVCGFARFDVCSTPGYHEGRIVWTAMCANGEESVVVSCDCD